MKHSSQNGQLETQDIKKRSIIGAVTLTSRTFILQIIALIATFILTILLDPATFGIFFVVTAVVNFLNYFSDIGLAAALIQKHEEPTQLDLATTFTIQQVLVISAVGLLLLFSNHIAAFYKLDTGGLFLLRALSISFFFSSLKTIPSVLLERKLDFQKLVIPQIVESLVFYGTAILFAYRGAGVVSFAWAALFRGISGTLLIYILAPWRIKISLEKMSAKRLLAFGIPYQANSFLALVKDDLLIIYLGKILPFTYVGYIGWAKKWAEITLRLIMDNIIKVTFPTFSRLQQHRELLAKAIEKSLLFMALLSFPIAIGMMFVIKPFIDIIPHYGKWEPALFSFYLFTFSAVLAAIFSPLVNALNALGKVKYTFYFMIMWTIMTWTIVPTSIRLFGFHGVAIASVFIGCTSFVPLVLIKRIIKINFWVQMGRPLLATLVLTLVMSGINFFVSAPFYKLMFEIVLGGSVYCLMIYILMGRELLPYFKLLTRTSTS